MEIYKANTINIYIYNSDNYNNGIIYDNIMEIIL